MPDRSSTVPDIFAAMSGTPIDVRFSSGRLFLPAGSIARRSDQHYTTAGFAPLAKDNSDDPSDIAANRSENNRQKTDSRWYFTGCPPPL
ncbi:MAG: hypothetical protein JSS81_20590 [Acidobacteria bacterium]|nr:hypothetical protein [Acidobacteriota bacterium]